MRPGQPTQRPKAYADAFQHLQDELAWLDRIIRRRVLVFRAALRAMEPAATVQQMYISHAEVDQLLRESAPCEGLSALEEDIATERARIDARLAETMRHGLVPPLVQLARMFRLTLLEQRALLVCLAPELDAKYDRLYAYLHDEVNSKRPTVRLVLELLCANDPERWRARAALTNRGVLLQMGLCHCGDDAGTAGHSELARWLRIDAAILSFVLGAGGVDGRLRPAVQLRPMPAQADDTADPVLVQRLRRLLENRVATAAPEAGRLVLNLYGTRGVGRYQLARAVCREFGWPLLRIDLELLFDGQYDEALVAAALRTSVLQQVPVYLDHVETVRDRDHRGSTLARRIARAIAQYCRLTFIASTRPWDGVEELEETAFHRVPVLPPDVQRRERIWQGLAAAHRFDPSWPGLLARQYRLTAQQIGAALSSAQAEGLMRGGMLAIEDLCTACRGQAQHALNDLATRIEPTYRWEQLVLPIDRLERLQELCSQVRQRVRVFEEWGFGQRLAHGKGLGALFTGPPGTGKTMAAEVVARELGLELYKIDLSGVISKYIGETEKNLAKIFQAAEASNAILFFDEADALFGKRTEVANAHDRYANIETSYLLQAMEAYEGVVILATNLRDNMDEAFLRRLRFIIDFPFPDEAQRLRIWQTHFPTQAPLAADVDFAALAARLQVAGGNIKNIVLNAAFLAAAEPVPIGMQHLLHSARREYEKIGKRYDELPLAKRATVAA